MVELIKKTVLTVILSTGAISFGGIVLEKKAISKGDIECRYILSLDIILTKDCNAFVLADGQGLDDYFFSIQNNSKVVMKDYGWLHGCFLSNDHPRLVFWKDGNIIIYDAHEGLNAADSIQVFSTKGFGVHGLIKTEETDKLYMLCSRGIWYDQLWKKAKIISSGGHAGGDIYHNYYLGVIKKDKIVRYGNIKFDNKRNQGYYVKATANDEHRIAFLGFKRSGDAATGFPPINSKITLNYSGYDLKKKKVTQSHDIYQIKYGPGSHNFGSLSIANKNNEVSVVFSLYKRPSRGASQNDIQQVKSDIYYFQQSDKSTSDTVKITKGFLPLVKVNSIGEVYVFWVDYDGNLVYKRKQGDRWSKEEVVLKNVDIHPAIASRIYGHVDPLRGHISMEFDQQDNLHVVFRSKGNLVYAKVKLDFTPDKQD